MYNYYGIYSSPYKDNGEEYLDTTPRATIDEVYLVCGTDEKVVGVISFDTDDLVACKNAVNIIRNRFGRGILDQIDFGNLDVEEALL